MEKKKVDDLSTGEVSIFNKKYGNIFAVFESISENSLRNYDAIIIDEAHFLSDDSRGQHLQNLLIKAVELGKDVVLCSATFNVEIQKEWNFKKLYLESKFKVPEKVALSELSDSLDLIYNGYKTIIFGSSIDSLGYIESLIYEHAEDNGYDTELRIAQIHSGILPSERLDLQLKFLKGELDVIISTNVLAQGLNFVCENLIIFDDLYNTPEILNQKLGRLGRPFQSSKEKVFYNILDEGSLDIEKKPVRLNKKATKDVSEEYFENWVYYNNLGNIEKDWNFYRYPRYNDIKYCIKKAAKLSSEMLKKSRYEGNKNLKNFSYKTLKLIGGEILKIREIILDNMN